MSEEKEQFAYTPEYQIKVLSYMVHDQQFCKVAGPTLEGEDFGDKARQWMFNTLSKSPVPLTYTTLKEELLKASAQQVIRKEEAPKYVKLYQMLAQPPTPAEQDHIKANMTTFMRTQALKRVIMDSADLIKSQRFDMIVSDIQNAVNRGFDMIDMGKDYFGTHEERAHERLTTEDVKCLLTGIPTLDHILNGGVKTSQVGLVVGGTGRGKSIFLQWLSRVAVLLNKTVVYFTLELSEEQISERFDSMFTHIKPHELITYNDDFLNTFNPLAQQYGKRLWIKKYPAGKATLATLENYLTVLASNGVVPDLVIVDYLDLLKPIIHRMNKHEELEDISTYMVGMAESFKTRIWTATQMNRMGFSMETPDETAIAGALAKLFPIDIGLFLAQTKDERIDEIIRILVAKNRNGRAGVVISLDTNYSYMTFYNEETRRDEEVKGELPKKPKKIKEETEENNVEQRRPEELPEFNFADSPNYEYLDDDDGIVVSKEPERDMLVLHQDGRVGPPEE